MSKRCARASTTRSQPGLLAVPGWEPGEKQQAAPPAPAAVTGLALVAVWFGRLAGV